MGFAQRLNAGQMVQATPREQDAQPCAAQQQVVQMQHCFMLRGNGQFHPQGIGAGYAL